MVLKGRLIPPTPLTISDSIQARSLPLLLCGVQRLWAGNSWHFCRSLASVDLRDREIEDGKLEEESIGCPAGSHRDSSSTAPATDCWDAMISTPFRVGGEKCGLASGALGRRCTRERMMMFLISPQSEFPNRLIFSGIQCLDGMRTAG